MSFIETITFAIAIVGAVTGLIGTGLSIWSICRQVDQDRVKLRVGASWALTSNSPDVSFLAVSVTNMSKFPVTVCEVGLLIDDDKQRAVHPHSQINDGSHLPKRMEPRTSISVMFPPDFLLDPRLKTARCAYASTDCGETVESPSKVIPAMVAEAQRD